VDDLVRLPELTRSQLAARTANSEIFTATHNLTLATMSLNPRGQTLGTVGLGNNGKRLTKKAQAFGTKVLYYEVVRQPEKEEARLDVTFCSELADLLKTLDCVSLHVPLD